MALVRESSTVVIRTARRAVGFRLLLAAGLLGVFAVFLWIMVPEKYFPWLLAAVVVVLLSLVWPLLRIFVTGTAFVLTERGLLAHFGDVDFVAWDEIEKATIGAHGVVEGIELELRDPEAVLGRLSVLRRSLLRAHIKKGGSPALAAAFGEGGAEVLLELIRRRIGPRDAEVVRGTRSPKPRAESRVRDTSEDEGEPSEFVTKPFLVMVAIAAVACIVGIAIALYVYRSRGWDWEPRVFAIVGMAAGIVSFGLMSLYTGKVEMQRGSSHRSYYRNKNPIMYWGCLAVILLLGIAVFLFGIGVLTS